MAPGASVQVEQRFSPEVTPQQMDRRGQTPERGVTPGDVIAGTGRAVSEATTRAAEQTTNNRQ